MNRSSFRHAVLPGVAALALALSACGAGNESDTGGGGDSDLSGELNIGGASSQEAAQGAWVNGFQTENPDVTVNYDPVGSGGGRESFISEAYPLAGSDAYLTDDEGELSDATERCGGEAPIEVPNYVSPIAIITSVEGVEDGQLNLSPETVAGIFAGEITEWDDPAIAETNDGVDLPSEPINAVHRSDESGTTENFTDYLDAVAPDVWTEGVVETWPQSYGGEGAAQTSGVVSSVESTPNSIGYADASQAGDLAKVNVGVGDEFVAPDKDAAAAILAASPEAEGQDGNALVFDIDHETEEAGTYPIVLLSYMIACPSYDDAAEGELAKAYLTYILSDAGQEQGSTEAGSAPLTSQPELLDRARELVDGIQVG